MNKFFVLLLICGIFIANKPLESVSLKGTWQITDVAGNTTTMICTDNYLMYAVYGAQKYVRSGGGKYQLITAGAKNILSFERDFATDDSTVVGLTVANLYRLENNTLILTEGPLMGSWKKIDESVATNAMAAAWRIKAREGADFKLQPILKGPRKTIKILSGNRFQWAAFNTDTKQFFGTGGGTYQLKNGKYSEKIEFFSRDNKRVGTELTFDCIVNGNEWTHAGQSTTGVRVHEVWEK